MTEWRAWHRDITPDNLPEIQSLEADQGRYLGYVRCVGRRREGIQLEEPIVSIATQYTRNSLLTGQE